MNPANHYSEDRISTGIKNLDALLDGGLPRQTVTLIGGNPGAGKTILSQRICFQNASPETPVLFVQTLSEPTAKTLRYLKQFDFFDPAKLEDGSVTFIDLGGIMRGKGLEQASSQFMKHLRKVKPSFVVIDSFKVFSDLAKSAEELRKFTYEIAIQLMAWECTSFLLGEFTEAELQTTPLSSIVDGIIMLTSRELSGEQQRFLQIMKMRGTNHDRDEHPFSISNAGLEIYASRSDLQRSNKGVDLRTTPRCQVGIQGFDSLIPKGIAYGTSVLISGAAGTGKTSFCLEALYRGATEYKEKGIFFTFDEPAEKLRATAQNMDWDLERELKRGMIRIISVPQTEILVEKHLLMIRDEIVRFGAKRVAIDSLSTFLYKVKDLKIAREKIYQLTTLITDAQAIGFLSTDVPFGSSKISQFGIEESILDGVIILTSLELQDERRRFIEVYKLRNTAHKNGRFQMTIGRKGIKVNTG